jgi:hypothetical protein
LGIWIGGQFIAIPQAFTESSGGVAYMAHIGGFFAGMVLIPFFKHRHVVLFDQGITTNWLGRPLNFQEVKTEARARYHGQTLLSKTKLPIGRPESSVPLLRRISKPKSNDNKPSGPWE